MKNPFLRERKEEAEDVLFDEVDVASMKTIPHAEMDVTKNVRFLLGVSESKETNFGGVDDEQAQRNRDKLKETYGFFAQL